MSDWDDWEDGPEPCSFCDGEGVDWCYDPIQCMDPNCDGEMCTCTACQGRGHSQSVW